MATAEAVRNQAEPASDADLVSGVLAREPGAFEALMRRHNRQLYRIARATLRDAVEAEDALQDAYVAALGSLAHFRGEASLATWLTRVVLNECLGRLRRSARRGKIVPITSSASVEELAAVSALDSERPDQIVDRAQLRALLERKLDGLPEIFRIVFVLRSVEDLSVEETAQCLGVPEATVRTRYFRAKRLLREALAADFDTAQRDVFDFGGERCDRVVAGVLARTAAYRERV